MAGLQRAARVLGEARDRLGGTSPQHRPGGMRLRTVIDENELVYKNYKLFVNPLFKTNWFCTYLLMDLNTVENYVRSNHTRI